jgi:hypothetical protein
MSKVVGAPMLEAADTTEGSRTRGKVGNMTAERM